MRADQMTPDLIASDLSDLKNAAMSLVSHAIKRGGFEPGPGPGPGPEPGPSSILFYILQCVPPLLAILLILTFRKIMDPVHPEQSSSRAYVFTALLTPYIFLTLPPTWFYFIRGEAGHWYVLIGVIARLLNPNYIVPGLGLSLPVLVVVAAPEVIVDLFNSEFRLVGLAICLAIVCYLMQEHVRASGGFKAAAVVPRNGIISMILLIMFFSAVWAFVELWLMAYLFWREEGEVAGSKM